MGCDFVERELQLCRPTLRTTVSYNYLVKLSLLSEIFEYVLLLLALVVKQSCMYVIRVAAVIYILQGTLYWMGRALAPAGEYN